MPVIIMFDSDSETRPQSKRAVFPRQPGPYFGKSLTIADFQLVRFISKGAFGRVEQYFSPRKNEMFAIKKIQYKDRNQEANIREITREIDILYKINSHYVIRLFDHFEDEEHAYLVMEYIDGKNLYEGVLKPRKELPLRIACSMIEEICLGLEEMHRQKVIHRDLKLENIMMFNGTIKIIDLGEANHFGEGVLRRTRRGTRSYFCPEILNNELQDDRVDSWCLGVIIYELTCMKSPFSANVSVEADLDENIRRLRYSIPEKLKHEKELLNLFSKVFAYKNQRIRIHEIRAHPFIRKYVSQNEPELLYENLFPEEKVAAYRGRLEAAIDKYRHELQEVSAANHELEAQIEEVEKAISYIRQGH